VNLLTYNTYPAACRAINRIDCETSILPGAADVEAIELDSEPYSPGETLKATAFCGRTAATSGGPCRSH